MHAHDPLQSGLDPNNPEDAELIDFFVEALPERVQSLQDAAGADDIQSIKRLAHQLKGSAPSYGFPKIGTAAQELEKSVNDSSISSIETIRSELDALINLCESYAKGSR
jgi:HPt (histidine-containing phosphotransfer) domain-containing protein